MGPIANWNSRNIPQQRDLIGLLFFILTPASFSLNGLFPSQQTKLLRLLALSHHTNLPIKNSMTTIFPICIVRLCTLAASVLFNYEHPFHCLNFGKFWSYFHFQNSTICLDSLILDSSILLMCP